MTSRMVGSVLTLVTLLFSVVGGDAQTYTQMQWGMNKGVTPYAFGANINGTWSNFGTVSVTGTWSLTLSNLTVSDATTFNSAVKLNSYAIAALPTCNAAALGSVAVVSNGTAYATGTYGSTVLATGIVTRSVLCTNTAGATTYAWAYN